MTRREKMLVGAVAAAGAMWFGTQGLTKYRDALDRNERLQLEAVDTLEDAKTAVARGQNARKQMNRWVRQSLPTQREVAKSLYQDWLREQLKASGLEVTQLSDRSTSSRNPQFEEVAEEIRATGAAEQLVDFLYRFYTAAHLHRISAATITASDAGKKLEASLTVTALILPDADRRDKLAEGPPQKLADSVEEFKKRLNGRNLFVAYTPKGDGGEAAKNEQASKASVTVMDYSDRGWRMGVLMDDDVKYYHQGDKIDIGNVKGEVVEIENRRAVIKTDKGRLELRIGQKLSEAVKLESPPA